MTYFFTIFVLEDQEEEEEREVTPVVSHEEEHAIGFVGALRIPGVIEFSMCLFFAKLVSYTFLYWLPNYISSKSHVDAEESAILSTVFDWGEFFLLTMQSDPAFIRKKINLKKNFSDKIHNFSTRLFIRFPIRYRYRTVPY